MVQKPPVSFPVH